MVCALFPDPPHSDSAPLDLLVAEFSSCNLPTTAFDGILVLATIDSDNVVIFVGNQLQSRRLLAFILSLLY